MYSCGWGGDEDMGEDVQGEGCVVGAMGGGGQWGVGGTLR